MSETKPFRRFLGLDSEEWNLVLLGIIAAAVLFRVFGSQLWWRIFITGGALGFIFEAGMAPLFTYCAKLRDRHCIDGSDVNFLLSLGWLEVFAVTCLVAEKILHMPTLPGYILAALAVGNANEFFFYLFVKRWTYNYDAVLIGRFRPFMPKITVSGVPVQVMAGYANVGIGVYCIVKYLVR